MLNKAIAGEKMRVIEKTFAEKREFGA